MATWSEWKNIGADLKSIAANSILDNVTANGGGWNTNTYGQTVANYTAPKSGTIKIKATSTYQRTANQTIANSNHPRYYLTKNGVTILDTDKKDALVNTEIILDVAAGDELQFVYLVIYDSGDAIYCTCTVSLAIMLISLEE